MYITNNKHGVCNNTPLTQLKQGGGCLNKVTKNNMIININLNGATSLVATLPVEHMAYVDSVVKFFENNVVAVKDDYRSVSVVDLESVITLGDSVKFQKDSYSNDENDADMVVSGRSGDVIKDFEPLTPEVLVSNKRQLAKVIKELESVNNENKMLKLQVGKLENQIEDLTKSGGV